MSPLFLPLLLDLFHCGLRGVQVSVDALLGGCCLYGCSVAGGPGGFSHYLAFSHLAGIGDGSALGGGGFGFLAVGADGFLALDGLIQP